MSFHTPVKPLKPKEMKLEEGVIKGAVIVDESMTDWNPTVGTIASTSTYTVINKNTEKLPDVVKRIAADLKLPDSEEYSLVFEDPKVFVSEENLNRLDQGFLLTMTVSPRHFAMKLKDNLNDSGDISSLETALLRLSTMTSDPVFVRAFYESSSIGQLYELLETETIKSNSKPLYLLLLSLSNTLDCGTNNINWTTVPDNVIHSLAVHIIGQAKSEDSNTVLIILQMMEKMLKSKSQSVRETVFSEVPTQSLIRHLEKSDERVNKAALSLMNSFHSNSEESRQLEIVELLDSVPFRSAVRGSVLRDGRIRDHALLEQLIPLQRLLLNRQAISKKEDATEEQIKQLLNIPILMEYGIGQAEIETALNDSNLGQFGAIHLTKFLMEHGEDVRILVSENSMRVSGGGWELLPMLLHCLAIVAELLNIIPCETEYVNELLEFLFTVDNPIENLFSLVIQLFHRTWREMQATCDESDKVGKVARQQIRKAIDQFSATLAGLEEAISQFPYWKMQEIWKREQAESETNQLSSQAVSTLRTQLLPSIEGLVRLNRKNFIKRGFTFRKVHKGKSSKDQFIFCKLDASEKYVIMTETDSDPYIEGKSTAGKVKKVLIKDISSVQMGDDGATLRKGGSLLRTIRVMLVDHEIITISASSDQALCAWLDGLNDLIGLKTLSQDATRNVDRLLNIELRLRLVAVPQPKENFIAPPLPKDFSWLKNIQAE